MGGGNAAEAYDKFKRRRQQTEARCEEQGLIAILACGVRAAGRHMSKAALTSVAKAVALKEMKEHSDIKRAMQHRIAVIIARSVAQRISMRYRRSIGFCTGVAGLSREQ